MQGNLADLPWYKQVSKTQWNTLLGAWLGWALDGLDFLMITYVLTDISKDLHLSLTVASTLVLATFATRWLGGAVFGSLADKLGRKKTMILGVITYSIATFLCGVSWSYTSLLVFRLFVGLGMAGEYSAGTTLLLESWPEKIRNKASGFLVSGWAVGGLLASTAYTLVVPHFGWRALFFVGIIPAIITIFIRLFVPESNEWTEANKKGKTNKVSFFQLFNRKWFPIALLLFLCMFSSFGMNWPILSLMPTYLKTIGYDPAAVGQIMFISNFGALIGYILSGIIADWIGTRRAVVYALLLSIVFLVLAFSIGKSNIALLGFIMFLVEMTNLGITGLWPKYVTEHFDVDVRSAGLGTTYNLGSIAGGLSPVWGSLLQNVMGLGWAVAVLTIFWTFIVIALIGFDVPKKVVNRKQPSNINEVPVIKQI
jgi:SHS family sialic acid transporter-like MFS transporter